MPRREDFNKKLNFKLRDLDSNNWQSRLPERRLD